MFNNCACKGPLSFPFPYLWWRVTKDTARKFILNYITKFADIKPPIQLTGRKKVLWEGPCAKFQGALHQKYEIIQTSLLHWFENHQRLLPWRESHSPYEVWISEIMLQQTQVKTVLPYYLRWMQRFPGIASVAQASEEELLKLWEGLGYYSRVRNIHKAARVIMDEHGGEFPGNPEAVRALPGIGPYTAGAVMSLAFNEPHAIVDGNVERVVARLFNLDKPVKSGEGRSFIWKTAREYIPHGKARDFNQAVMELGAMVCLPRKPLCVSCPLTVCCESHQLGLVDQRPVKGPGRVITPLGVSIGLLLKGDRVFIQKRSPHGLMPHLWEFPGGKIQKGESPERALVREFQEELEVSVHNLHKIGVIRHSYTSFRVTLHAFFCELRHPHEHPALKSAVKGLWVSREDLKNYPFPAANRKLIDRL